MRVYAVVTYKLGAVDAVAGGRLRLLAAVALLLAADHACSGSLAYENAQNKRNSFRIDRSFVNVTVCSRILSGDFLENEALLDHITRLTLKSTRRADDHQPLCTYEKNSMTIQSRHNTIYLV